MPNTTTKVKKVLKNNRVNNAQTKKKRGKKMKNNAQYYTD